MASCCWSCVPRPIRLARDVWRRVMCFRLCRTLLARIVHDFRSPLRSRGEGGAADGEARRTAPGARGGAAHAPLGRVPHVELLLLLLPLNVQDLPVQLALLPPHLPARRGVRPSSPSLPSRWGPPGRGRRAASKVSAYPRNRDRSSATELVIPPTSVPQAAVPFSTRCAGGEGAPRDLEGGPLPTHLCHFLTVSFGSGGCSASLIALMIPIGNFRCRPCPQPIRGTPRGSRERTLCPIPATVRQSSRLRRPLARRASWMTRIPVERREGGSDEPSLAAQRPGARRFVDRPAPPQEGGRLPLPGWPLSAVLAPVHQGLFPRPSHLSNASVGRVAAEGTYGPSERLRAPVRDARPVIPVKAPVSVEFDPSKSGCPFEVSRCVEREARLPPRASGHPFRPRPRPDPPRSTRPGRVPVRPFRVHISGKSRNIHPRRPVFGPKTPKRPNLRQKVTSPWPGPCSPIAGILQTGPRSARGNGGGSTMSASEAAKLIEKADKKLNR